MPDRDENLTARFIRRSASFGTLLIAVKAVNFLFLFVYWHILDPEDFAVIAVAEGVSSVLAPALNLGLSNAVSRLWKEYSARGEGGDLVWTTYLLSTICALLFCSACSLFGAPLFALVFPSVPFDPYLRIAVWSSFFLSLCIFGDQVIRVKDRLKLNGLLVAAEFLLKNAFILALLHFYADLPYAYLMGELCGLALLSAFYTKACASGGRLRPSPAFLGEPVRLALPIIPAGMLSQINNYIDRFVLVNYVDRTSLGLFTQAEKICSVLDIITRAFKTVWFPTIIRSDCGIPDERLLRRSYIFAFDFLAFTVLAMSFAGVPVIRLIAPERYHPMCVYLPAVGGIMLVKNFIFLPALRLLATRFALATLISTALTTAVAAGLHFTLTVRFGIAGALVSLGGTYVFSFAAAELLARRACPSRLPWGMLGLRFAVFAAAAAGAAYVISLGPTGEGQALLAAGFCLTCVPAAAYYAMSRKRLLT